MHATVQTLAYQRCRTLTVKLCRKSWSRGWMTMRIQGLLRWCIVGTKRLEDFGRHRLPGRDDDSIGSITQLLCSLHTLDAAISDDSPMLAF